MKKHILTLLLALTAVASAAIAPLTNGNFETQAGTGEAQNVDSWFEFSSANYHDWVNVAPNAASQYPAGQGNILMMSSSSGYIYQSIGTRTSTDLGLRVTGKAILRYPGAVASFRPFTVSVYQTNTGITGADGTHPSALSGATLLSSKTVSSASLAFSAPPTGPESNGFTVDLSLGSATDGKLLWVVFDAESGSNETGLDDLVVATLATDPGSSAPVATPKIMLLGDSFWQNDGMRQGIYNGLTAAGESFDFVGSEGRGTGPAGLTSGVTDPDHEGVASKQVIHAINGRLGPANRKNTRIKDLMTTHDPDIVALQLGTNDTWYNFQTAQAPYLENVGRSPVQLIADIKKLSRIIHTHDPTTRIIVTTVTPIISPNTYIGAQADTYNTNVITYNALLATAVTEMLGEGIHVTLNDNHTAWGGTATGNTGSDGLHPNATGDTKAANAWVASIRQALTAFDGNVHYDTIQKIEAGDSDARKIEKAAKTLPLKKQVDWQRLETTYFIHYGPNVFTEREWGTGLETPNTFAPTDYDAAQWVTTVKNAGGKMVMLVVKHHEGFCLYPSRYTTHDLESSAWKNGLGNIVKDVSEACAAQGLKFGIYLSPADSYQIESSTNYTTGAGYYGRGSAAKASKIPTDPATFSSNPTQTRALPAGFHSYEYTADDYNRYFLNQLYELLTEYGDIAEVWFDGATPKTGPQPQTYNRQDWYDLITKLRPNANIAIKGPHVRWVGNEGGHPRPNEWSVLPIPESPTTYTWNDQTATDLGSRSKLTTGSYLTWWPAETDVPILQGWFYKNTHTVKSSSDIIDLYYNSVGNNSNLLLNLSPDKRGLIPDNQIDPLMNAMTIVNQTFANNLATSAALVADSSLAGNPISNAIDGNLDTYWEPSAGNSTPSITITFGQAKTIDRIVLQEAIAQRSMRIEAFAIDTWNGSTWQQQATSGAVGHKRIVKIPETTTTKVRIRITQSRLEPSLANIGVFKSATLLASPVIGNRSNSGKVTITSSNGYSIYYTIDGSTPTTSSTLYTSRIDLPLGGTIKAISSDGSSVSLTVSKTFAGYAPNGWQVISVDSEESPADDADNAIDGDPATIWHTEYNQAASGPHPHHITVDMQTVRWIGGFSYLPRTGSANGIVKTYRFEISEDNSTWTNVSQGEFLNIAANPVQQNIFFPKIKARYFRFTSLSEINGNAFASAAEINVLLAGYEAFIQQRGEQDVATTSDTDGDNQTLLEEYYFGNDPDANDSPSVKIKMVGATAQVEVIRNTNATDITAELYYSTDLTNWIKVTPVNMTSTAMADSKTKDTYSNTAGTPKTFYRVKLTH